MKYRAKIYIEPAYGVSRSITTPTKVLRSDAEWSLDIVMRNIEQATGGHIEKYVDGVGWVVCEEEGG